MSTLRVSNIEAKADPSSPSVDEKLKVTNSNGDVLVHIDGKTVGVTTVGINTTDRTFTVDAAQNVEFLGIVTATKFSLSGGGEITGGDGNFTGIVTAGSGDYSGGLSVGTAITAVSATFTGDVSIGGTLTYEDVTNIDSIGIITARSNIDAQSDVIVGAGLSVVGISTLANTNINGQLTATNARITGVTTFGTSSTTINGAHEYPSIRPTLDLNFAATKTLDRRITFTRDSLGTYTDELGIIRTVSNNTPRFDHDPVTGESLGLLIEEQRTNLCINSTSSSNWGTPFQLTKDASKTITAPSGDIDAYEWTETTDSTTHLNNGPSVSISSGSSYSISAFFKRTAGTLDRGYLLQWYKGGGQTVRVSYVPSTDTTYISNSNGASAPTNVSVVTYPNGWYKISFTAALAETSALAIVGVTDSSGLTNFTGDTSVKHSFWGLQYEQASFPTSYIPTSGSTVTRNKDITVIKGTNFTDVFDTNFKEFSLLVDYDNSKTDDGTYREIVSFWGESTGYDDRIGITKDDQSPYHIETRAFGAGSAIFNNGNLSASSKAATQKFATSWSVPDYSNTSSRRWAFCFSGETPIDVVPDNSGTSVPAITRLGLGINPTRLTEDSSGGLIHYKRFVAYNKALPDSQLQGLTAQ